jgi:hypothetical protein
MIMHIMPGYLQFFSVLVLLVKCNIRYMPSVFERLEVWIWFVSKVDRHEFYGSSFNLRASNAFSDKI